jgi:hypothetical protein
MPNNLVVSGNLTINGTATYVNTESISSKDPLFEVANTNNTTDAVDIGYYGRYYDAIQERVEFTGLFRDASDAGKFKIFTGLVDEPTNVVNTTGTGYTVATLVANVDGNLNGTANAANILSTARTIAASGDATWSVSFNGSANVSSALTLANTGVTATTYGTSTAVPTIAVDSKGRITSASNTNITFPVTTVNGFAGTVVLTTSDVAEGTNQYFTTARAQAAITGGASSVVTANLTASRALVSDGSGKIAASATTTTTEIGYLAGVTSAIQTQLNGKLNLTGGTLTGPLIGTTGSFSSSGSGDTFTIAHTSGSGIALNITKNGNGEGLYINKASGSGNAATIVGNLGGTTADFSGILTTPQVKAATSAGLSINSNGGTQIANLGAGGGANMTLYGGLTGTSATFSGALNIGGNQTFTGVAGTTRYIITDESSTGTGRLVIQAGAGSAAFGGAINLYAASHPTYTGDVAIGLSATTGAKFRVNSSGLDGGTDLLTILRTGAATFSSSVTANSTINGYLGTITGGQNPATSGTTPTNPMLNLTNNRGIGLYVGGQHASPFGIWMQVADTTNLGVKYPLLLQPNGGSVGIGTPSPLVVLHILAGTAGSSGRSRLAHATSGAQIDTYVGASDGCGIIVNNNPLFFEVNSGERMRITSGGVFKASTDGTYDSIGGTANEFNQSVADWGLVIRNKNASNPYGLYLKYTGATPNGTSNEFIYCTDGSGVLRANLRSNGGLANYQANNVNLSDERTKKDIIPLESYWNKFKAIEIVKFKYKDQTHDDFNIGVIAQQVESVAPEFIDIDGWDNKPKLDEDDNEIVSNEEPLKSVYTSDLHHATIKVLQEAMAKIETLEAKIAILEAK